MDTPWCAVEGCHNLGTRTDPDDNTRHLCPAHHLHAINRRTTRRKGH